MGLETAPATTLVTPALILVVDDSPAQRQLLRLHLKRWNYRVLEAASGKEALALCQIHPIDIVISDWMMPEMNGLALCRAFRALPREDYGYFILVTSKSERSELAEGLEAGADDFLTKPVDTHELRARLTAGLRLQRMQVELAQRNRIASEAMTTLQSLYDQMERDLIEASKLQRTLMRDRRRDFSGASVAMVNRAAGHVGGDLVGCLALDSDTIAAYAIDVSGHGVASAMLTARLAGLLFEGADQSLAVALDATGRRGFRPPAELMRAFNRLMLEDLQVEQYFTMIHADLDLRTGALRLTQAGHPHPYLLRPDGRICRLGHGGMPIGLIAEAAYDEITLTLAEGDRLLLISDGISECPGPHGDELGEEGVEALIRPLLHHEGEAFLQNLLLALDRFTGRTSFPDDVSALLLSYAGPTQSIAAIKS